MADNDKTITLFTTRVRQLMLSYGELKKENDGLYAFLDEKDKEIDRLQKEVKALQADLNLWKASRMVELTDQDVDGAKQRIGRLIREVNKCITLLSER